MKYYFVVNGRSDKQSVLQDLQNKLGQLNLPNEIYVTEGIGDATRHLRTYCEFHPNEEVCFVACGGSGTANEVASAIIGQKNKSMAFLAYGTSNDFIKSFPDLDFLSLGDMLAGETRLIDIIKCNDDYSFNVLSVGFDAATALYANINITEGLPNPYSKAIGKSLLFNRFNNLQIWVDGKKISSWRTLLCAMANGRFYGNRYMCAPMAEVDDGLMDVCLVHSCSLFTLLAIMKYFEKGTYITNSFCRKRMEITKGKEAVIKSKNLCYVALDGEIIAGKEFNVKVLDKALNFRFPAKREEGRQ